MTQFGPSMPPPPRHAWKLGFLIVARVMLSVSLLLAAYYLIPASGR